MRLLLFTKDMKEYDSFISKSRELFNKVKIVFPENHPRKSESSYRLFLKKCSDFNPDVIVSFYYNRIIQSDIINLSNVISVNFHGSLLPNYAGSHALNWQIANGEKKSGVTIHTLTSKVDSGQIVAQQDFKIESRNTAGDILALGIATSCRMLGSFYEDLCKNNIKLQDQVLTGNEFICRKRVPEDSKIIKTMSPEDVCNLVRALIPLWPPAFYIDKNYKSVKIENIIDESEASKILSEVNLER